MKKNSLIILSFIILFLNPSEIIGQTKSSFELDFAPTISYRRLNEKMNFHNAALRFEAGILYQYNLKKRVKISSGIYFSKKGYNGEYEITDFDNNQTTIRLKYNRNFIELPIYLKYLLKENTGSRLFIDGGLVNQLLIGEFMERTNFPNMTNNYSDLREQGRDIYNVAFLIGFSYHKNITEKVYLAIAPYFTYGLISMDNIHDLTAGLKFGIGICK